MASPDSSFPGAATATAIADTSLEGHSVIFAAVQTQPSGRIRLTVDPLGLHWSGSWSRWVDPPQDFPEPVPRHGGVGQLERDGATVARDLVRLDTYTGVPPLFLQSL